MIKRVGDKVYTLARDPNHSFAVQPVEIKVEHLPIVHKAGGLIIQSLQEAKDTSWCENYTMTAPANKPKARGTFRKVPMVGDLYIPPKG